MVDLRRFVSEHRRRTPWDMLHTFLSTGYPNNLILLTVSSGQHDTAAHSRSNMYRRPPIRQGTMPRSEAMGGGKMPFHYEKTISRIASCTATNHQVSCGHVAHNQTEVQLWDIPFMLRMILTPASATRQSALYGRQRSLTACSDRKMPMNKVFPRVR